MKKFVFRLAALKRYRENRLLIARKDLIAVETRLHDLTAALRHAYAERSDLIGTETTDAAQAGLRLVYSDLIQSETIRIRTLEMGIKKVEEERERHARWVTHLGRELKAIEKLEERQREAHDQEMMMIEKRASDGWVAERWFHTLEKAKADGGSEVA
ncbi:MAG: hypothetical protein JST16_02325 [Bdellovibrionales bacterium]|nr:hypothetical protein [Bdellovibrionales bacterium]